MSWKFPPEPIRPGQVVDTDNLNENFLTYTEELSGALNEHNFSIENGAPFTRDNLATDAAFHLHMSGPSSAPNPNDYNGRTGWLLIRRNDGWQTYTGDTGANTAGMGLKFNAVGSLCWICGSINIQAADVYNPEHVGGPARYDQQLGYGFNVAIQLNGVTLYESLVGSADSMNEFYNGDDGLGHKLKPASKANLDTPQCGGGVNGSTIAVAVDAIVEVPPGVQDVKIAVMSIKGRNSYGDGHAGAYISTRELFVLELLR